MTNKDFETLELRSIIEKIMDYLDETMSDPFSEQKEINICLDIRSLIPEGLKEGTWGHTSVPKQISWIS